MSAAALADPGQAARLARFRRAHRHVAVGTLTADGPWQARIPRADGETVVTRYDLGDLLDELDVQLGEPGEGNSDA